MKGFEPAKNGTKALYKSSPASYLAVRSYGRTQPVKILIT
jgi:hypothetical protein